MKFTSGITLDDLEITVEKGYDKTGIADLPDSNQFVSPPCWMAILGISALKAQTMF